MSKIWFTSDPHFGHRNVIRYCGRPFEGIAEMERILIENWNATVGPQDTVYVLGDVFFCGMTRAKEVLAKLNGYKILVKGNHDRQPAKMLEIGFNEVHIRLEKEFNGRTIRMCHFPYKPKTSDIPRYVVDVIDAVKKEQKQTGMDSSGKIDEIIENYVTSGVLTKEQGSRLISYDMRFMNDRFENEGHWLLCGHVHEKWAIKDNMINVGVDVRGFKPISLEEVEAIIEAQEKVHS